MSGLVNAPEPLAIKVGQEVLDKGGNAFDAAVAAVFVQGVANPMQCGIGGTGLFQLHHGPTQETLLLDCSCTMGSARLPGVDNHQYGYQSIMIPGVVKGLWDVFRRFGSGKISWAELIEPAEVLASTGFVVEKYLASQWAHITCPLSEDASSFSRPRRLGERLIQEDYGSSLRRVARSGADDFYSGTMSNDISLDMEENGGILVWDDLQQYTTADVAPIHGSYRGFEVCAGVSGSFSSAQVLAMLQIVEGFDLRSMDVNDPEYMDILVQAMRAGFIDYLPLRGDPPFTVALHMLAQLTSPDRSQFWQERITSGLRAKVDSTNYQGSSQVSSQGSSQGSKASVAGFGATHLCVADNKGSVVSWTHGIGGLCGSGVITPGLGFLYNNYASRFNWTPGHWDSVARGKRGGEGVPLLLFENGKPYMAIGGVGGERAITAVLQVIVNVVDHKMPLAEAIAAPRLHMERNGEVCLEPGLPEASVEGLQSLGYCVNNTDRMSDVIAR